MKDKVVVITGASAGIGEASARRCAQDGARVVLGRAPAGAVGGVGRAIATGPCGGG